MAEVLRGEAFVRVPAANCIDIVNGRQVIKCAYLSEPRDGRILYWCKHKRIRQKNRTDEDCDTFALLSSPYLSVLDPIAKK